MSTGIDVEEIELGDHICMVYDEEKEKLYTVILFIVDGLKKGELVFVLNEDKDEIIKVLGEVIDVRRFLEKKQLVFLSKDESYLRDGYFDSDKMLEIVTELDEKALVEGYKGLRLVSNADWVLTYPKIESFFEYEAKMNKYLPLTRCIALCLFDERKFDPDVLLKVLQTHPKIISGKDVRKNLNYQPPDMFLRKLRKNMKSSFQKIIDKKLRREFEEIEKKFRLLFESPFDAVMILRGSRLISCNSTAIKIFGYRRFQDLLGKDLYDLLPDKQSDGSDSREFLESKIKAANKGEPQFFELSFAGADGKLVDLEVSLTKLGSDNLMAIARDVTERKRMEESLRESEERYRLLVNTSIDAIITINSKAEILTWNRGAENIYGYKEEEIIGKPLIVLIPERFREKFRKGFESFIKLGSLNFPGKYMETVGLRKNGEEFPVEMSYYSWKTSQGIFYTAIVRDISERKKMEKGIREGEEKFRIIAEKSLVGVYLIQDGIFKYVSPKLAEDFGYEVDEIIGKEVLHFIHPKDRKIVSENIRKRIEGEIESARYKLRVVRKNGEVRTFEVFGSKISYRGKPAIVGTAIDITEDELHKRRLESYERFFRNARDIFFILDKNGRFIDVNPKFAEILGYTSKELIGHTSRKIAYPEDLDGLRSFFKKILSGEAGRHEFRAVTKDGRVLWFELVEWPVYGEEIEIEGIVRDITERKMMEKKEREYLEQLKVLHSLDESVLSGKPLKEVAELVVTNIRRFIGCEAAAIFTYDEGKDQFVLLASSLDDTKIPIQRFSRVGFEKFRKVDDLSEIKITTELDKELLKAGVRSYITIPLVAKGELIGLFGIASKRKDAFEDKMDFVYNITSQLAIALHEAILFEMRKKAFRQIEENIEQFATLVDQIRNPLGVILGTAELSIRDQKVRNAIVESVEKIDEVLKKLDEGWLESEKIREFLRASREYRKKEK